VPPSRGSTRTRTGGGTRSLTALPKLDVLAPDHVGLTTRAAPKLAFFSAGRADASLVLTLLRDDAIDPDLEVTLADVVEPGITEIDLARYEVSLVPGLVYTWSVSLVDDPALYDASVVAGGAVERVAEVEGLPSAGMSRYRALAGAGIWYDALAELNRGVAAGDAAMRVERAALLEDVGLSSAAAWEHEQIGDR
jgi:hypothetical protein